MRYSLLSPVLLAVVLGILVATSSQANAAPPNERPSGTQYPGYYGSWRSDGSTYYPPMPDFSMPMPGYYNSPMYSNYYYGSMYSSYYYYDPRSYYRVPMRPPVTTVPRYNGPPASFYWTPDGWSQAW